jgi:hypothetical protein
MDPIIRRILDELRHDAALSVVELANRAGLSPTPFWKRGSRTFAALRIICGAEIIWSRPARQETFTQIASLQRSERRGRRRRLRCEPEQKIKHTRHIPRLRLSIGQIGNILALPFGQTARRKQYRALGKEGGVLADEKQHWST